MRIVIVTGMSGAGKSHAANVLEDMGYYCVDNLPTALLPRFAEFCISAQGKYEKVALVTDIREGDIAGPLIEAVDVIERMGCECRIVYLEASVDAIVRRYKESRRPHPLAESGELITHTIEREMQMLSLLRERADHIIDTTTLKSSLMVDLLSGYLEGGAKRSMRVEVLSFGFKYGVPNEADLIFDVRFLPNPYYVEDLRPQTGLDLPVRDYVFSFDMTHEFLERLMPVFEFLLPAYAEEGKSALVIGIGCTGGRHRSTAIASEIAKRIGEMDYEVSLFHRDVEKG